MKKILQIIIFLAIAFLNVILIFGQEKTIEKTEVTTIDAIIKVISPLVPFLAIIIGVWQFNKGQKLLKEKEIEQRKFEIEKLNQQYLAENLKKFKDNQNQLYSETARIISFLASSKNIETPEYENKIQRFWELFWVELSSVETEKVKDMMEEIGGYVEEIEKRIVNKQNAKDIQEILKNKGYDFAQIIKEEYQNWEYTEFMKKILEAQNSVIEGVTKRKIL